ncbi:hypothetical protein FBU30_001690 [Linnemannia zychae]|nr:hypothetical protein FBU30_001690 [Linnemannia zychae]
MASILRPVYAFYNRHYQARPILTICITNAFLAGISDTITQKYLTPPPAAPQSTSEKVLQKFEEIVDNANISLQESATELEHSIDNAMHNDASADKTASIALENIKEKAEDYVNRGQELVQQGKQQVQDMLSQSDLVLHNEDKNKHDYMRTGRFMFYNFSVAPIIHTWYTILDKNFPIAAQAINTKQNQQLASRVIATMKPAMKRVAADQILFAPVGLVMLFSGLTVLEGGGVQQIKDKLHNTFIPTLKANYLVWPMVQLVNFSVMPLQLRLPFVSMVGIAWNAYLSLMNTRGKEREKQQQHLLDIKEAQSIAT